jgi:hypothetical protein
MNDWKEHPKHTTVQKGARVVHERKALPDNELDDRCPRMSVHVHGQRVTKSATKIDISPCKHRLSVNDAADFFPVLSGTGRGQNRQRWRAAV